MQTSRRNFLKLGALGAAAPFILPSHIWAAETPPSAKVTMGFIGMGKQSQGLLGNFLGLDTKVLAVCDVDTTRREHALDVVRKHDGEKADVKGYEDFRELLARKDIDAVCIATPDHWHAIITVAALRAGKDVYCEKPLTHNIHEAIEVMKAVEDNKRVLQTGSMQRSSKEFRIACELVRNGCIGKLERVETYVAENNFKGPGPGWKEMPVPEGFDYDMWLGPAPKVPYHKDRCFYRFRFILDYSGGQTTNFGCHSNNVAHWGMGVDDTGPVEIEDIGAEFPLKGDLFTTPTKVAFRARYANGVVLECKTDKRSFGATFFGSKGLLRAGYKAPETEPASIAKEVIGPNEIHLPVSPNHYRNFLDCVKSRQDPIEPVETGHRTASLCHLGNIAMRLNKKIKWDPRKEEIVGDSEAAKMIARPMRAPWNYNLPLKA